MLDGCPIDDINLVDILSLIHDMIQKNYKDNYITPLNVTKLGMMQTDLKLANVIKESTFTIADGYPVYLAGRLLGARKIQRLTGIALMEELFRKANKEKYRVYLFGARPEILRAVVDTCQLRYPLMKIVGYRDGYFTKDEEEDIVYDIGSLAPDLLLLALGLPQKEYFISDHLERLNCSIILPVGGGFDVFAGVKRRAPQIIQEFGVEWLWRSVYDRTRTDLVFRSAGPFISSSMS